MAFDDYYDFRKTLVDCLVMDVLGPSSESEVIDDPPITRYVTGILFPSSDASLSPELDVEEDEGYDESALPDPPVSMANRRYPSSMGITFAVSGSAELRVVTTAARYEEVEESGEASRRSFRRGTEPGQKWKRVPLEIAPTYLDLSQASSGDRKEISEGLDLFWRVRNPAEDGSISVTVGLVNTIKLPPASLRDAVSFFQPTIRVEDRSGAAAFVERMKIGPKVNDEDLRAYRLLYRHAKNFATGHGCSVDWEIDHSNTSKASAINSTFVPQYPLLLADSNPDIRGDFLSMSYLVKSERKSVLGALRDFCDSYATWIEELKSQIPELEEEFDATAHQHVGGCAEALRRMRGGLDLLEKDDLAWKSFRLANEAMLRVRARTVWIKAGRPGGGPNRDESHRWRPFQLAFILLCIKGIADAGSEERDLADLLWFPTGGGKTEAYLGLIAFTIFLRRHRNPLRGSGVTVLMRYTMRLLTIQQFERATLLIATCEELRREARDLGKEEISIGLWVGKGGTPNSLPEARLSLDRLRAGQTVVEANPVQLHECPWCGYPLDHSNYYIGKSNQRLVVCCRQADCFYREGLPVHLVDDQIYRLHPSLIVATVDKFAGLPWKEQVGNLFNRDDPDLAGPELIIQDELHLISGPLGTLTGLYETAVDYLCTTNGIRPKVVASTATIRRAGHQAKALFDREVRQFPPPGLDARDSYFSVEAGPTERGTRLYVGVMAPATSQTSVLVRAYASLLQRAADRPGEFKAKDPYWTLVGYFNSLRLLASARMQVQDDVEARIGLLSGTEGSSPRTVEHQIELTSRAPSGEIPDHLRRMALEIPDEDALDVILATNMISVGVDIDRLGLMVVMGQPQSTSEYIQATSRVGRQFPGLAVVLFNSARSRDRSHYESFVPYHSALYRQVESTSVTPFSPRARDRGLHAVFVALARLIIPAFGPNPGAGDVEKFLGALDEVKSILIQRVARVSPEEVESTAVQIDGLIDEWRERAETNPDLVFANPSHPDKALLVDAGRDDLDGEGTFLTLWSLRDVDRSSNLYLVR